MDKPIWIEESGEITEEQFQELLVRYPKRYSPNMICIQTGYHPIPFRRDFLASNYVPIEILPDGTMDVKK